MEEKNTTFLDSFGEYTNITALRLFTILLFAYPTMAAWNMVMVKFGLPAINFFEAFALDFIITFLIREGK